MLGMKNTSRQVTSLSNPPDISPNVNPAAPVAE